MHWSGEHTRVRSGFQGVDRWLLLSAVQEGTAAAIAPHPDKTLLHLLNPDSKFHLLYIHAAGSLTSYAAYKQLNALTIWKGFCMLLAFGSRQGSRSITSYEQHS